MLTALAHAWQSWRSARSVLGLGAAALAVGIAGTTAVFTVVNAVMVKPLTYEHGERIGVLFGATRGDPKARTSLTFADAVRYQHATRSFDVFGWFRPETYTLTAPGLPRHVQGAAVTTSLAHHLGIAPLVGRWFQDETGAVISSGLWARLGGSRAIVGQAIVLNGRPFTVTGVMPPRFRLPEIGHAGDNVRNDVWIALDPTGRTPGSQDGGFFFAYARLKPGVSFEQADADVKRVAAAIAAAEPFSHPGYTARFDSLRGLVVEGIRPTLLVLLAAATLLFFIACANVAALLLARSVARVRDTALRVALGASKGRLALQFFAEGLLVALVGAAAGVLLSLVLVKVVVTMAAEYIPRADEVALDWRVLLFTLSTGILASALSSLAPLWQATRTQPNDVLSDGVRSTAGARSRRLSGSLVVAELALAFTLLSVGAALLLDVSRLSHARPGFDADHLLTFQITLPDTMAAEGERRVGQQIRFVDTLKALPGVQAVGLANQTLLNGCCLSTALYPDGELPDLSTPQKVSFLPINPAYFETLRIPLRRGRLLAYQDSGSDVLLVVLNEAAVRRYWPRRDALGAFGRIGRPDGSRFQVIGVVGDVRNDGLDKPTVPEVYMLHSAVPVNPMHVVVRSTLPPQVLLSEVRRAILTVDPAQPIHDEATMDQVILTSMSLERVASAMSGFFAAAALLMAALGVYGVMSYSVRQRTVELGTRMALGAVGRDVLALVLGGGLKIAAAGLALGALAVTLGSWWLARGLQLPHMGWALFVSAAVTIDGLAALASLVPAWRASRLSPMVAIRNDASPLWASTRSSVRSALRNLSKTVSTVGGSAAERPLPSPALFVDAARGASSTSEALQLALSTLAAKLDVEWVMLLEDVEGPRSRYVGARSGGVPTRGELPASGFLVKRLQFHGDALPMSAGDLDAWLNWASLQRPQHTSEIEALRDAGARLAVALRTRSTASGVLLLGAPAGRDVYTMAERHALRQGAGQLALMLENSRLTLRIVEQEALRRDLALAAEVQKRLLPERPPQDDVASLAAFTIAARNVAGDYYDFLKVGDHRLGIALADVSGKGVAAALIMSVVQASLRIIASDERVPLTLLAARMNQFLYRSTQSSSYATFFYAQLDERTRQMEYVNAGHNPPYLVRAAEGAGEEGTTITELSVGGMVLGLFPEVTYEQASVDLRSGDVLFIFSDGLPEALDAADQEFGTPQLKRLLREHRRLPAQALADRIAEAVRTWAAGAPQHDDVTFVVMKVV